MHSGARGGFIQATERPLVSAPVAGGANADVIKFKIAAIISSGKSGCENAGIERSSAIALKERDPGDWPLEPSAALGGWFGPLKPLHHGPEPARRFDADVV